MTMRSLQSIGGIEVSRSGTDTCASCSFTQVVTERNGVTCVVCACCIGSLIFFVLSHCVSLKVLGFRGGPGLLLLEFVWIALGKKGGMMARNKIQFPDYNSNSNNNRNIFAPKQLIC